MLTTIKVRLGFLRVALVHSVLSGFGWRAPDDVLWEKSGQEMVTLWVHAGDDLWLTNLKSRRIRGHLS